MKLKKGPFEQLDVESWNLKLTMYRN